MTDFINDPHNNNLDPLAEISQGTEIHDAQLAGPEAPASQAAAIPDIVKAKLARAAALKSIGKKAQFVGVGMSAIPGGELPGVLTVVAGSGVKIAGGVMERQAQAQQAPPTPGIKGGKG